MHEGSSGSLREFVQGHDNSHRFSSEDQLSPTIFGLKCDEKCDDFSLALGFL